MFINIQIAFFEETAGNPIKLGCSPPGLLALVGGRKKEVFFLFCCVITDNKFLPKIVLIRLSEKICFRKIYLFFILPVLFLYSLEHVQLNHLYGTVRWKEFLVAKMWSKCAVSAAKRLSASYVTVWEYRLEALANLDWLLEHPRVDGTWAIPIMCLPSCLCLAVKTAAFLVKVFSTKHDRMGPYCY